MQTVKGNIIIHEVGLRDGLQNEKQVMPLDKKQYWLEMLIAAGLEIIQVGSFVHPEKMPQMADTDRLFAELNASGKKPDNVIFSALVLNEKGLERGLACGVDMFCMGVSASNTHSLKNTGMSTAEAVSRIIPMAQKALAEGKKVQVSVQSAFGCGFEGRVPEQIVLDIIKRYLDAGLLAISLADTAGYAYPTQVIELFSRLFELDKKVECACHFHDTFGAGIANCYAARQAGVTVFETAFGSLGGCPYTRISSGNVCTEDLVYLFKREGISGLPDLETLLHLTQNISYELKRELAGRIYKAGIPSLIMESDKK